LIEDRSVAQEISTGLLCFGTSTVTELLGAIVCQPHAHTAIALAQRKDVFMVDWFVDKRGVQSAIDAAEYDGARYVLPPEIPMHILLALKQLLLARQDGEHWQLTNMGEACLSRAKGG
jgi:hypothetical protein